MTLIYITLGICFVVLVILAIKLQPLKSEERRLKNIHKQELKALCREAEYLKIPDKKSVK